MAETIQFWPRFNPDEGKRRLDNQTSDEITTGKTSTRPNYWNVTVPIEPDKPLELEFVSYRVNTCHYPERNYDSFSDPQPVPFTLHRVTAEEMAELASHLAHYQELTGDGWENGFEFRLQLHQFIGRLVTREYPDAQLKNRKGYGVCDYEGYKHLNWDAPKEDVWVD